MVRLKLDISAIDGFNKDQETLYSALMENSNSDETWNLSQNDSLVEDLKTSTPISKHSSTPSTESSPSRVDRKNDINSLKSENISPIKSLDTITHKLITPLDLGLHMTPIEITMELKRLVEQINDQKSIVLECLENDCDKEELNSNMDVRKRFIHNSIYFDNAQVVHIFLQ